MESRANQTGEATGTQVSSFLLGLGDHVSDLRRLTGNTPTRPQSALLPYPLGGAAGDGDGGAEFSRVSAFLLEDGYEAERDETTLARGFTQHTYATTAGFDYRVNTTFFIGASASYVTGETDINSELGSQDIDLFSAAFHGSKYWRNVFVDWFASYGWQELDIERFDGSTNYLADTDGNQWSADLSAGYQYSHKRWRITPAAKAFHLSGDLDGYRETALGAGGTPRQVASQDFESTVASISVQGEYVFLTDWGIVMPSFELAFRHEFSDADRITERSAIAGGGTSSNRPDDPDANTWRAKLGVTAQFQRGLSAFARYEQLFGHEFLDSYSVVAGIRYELPEGFYDGPLSSPGPR